MHIRFPVSLVLYALGCVLFTNAQVKVNPTTYDFGNVEVASTLTATYAFTNNSAKNVYLLKAETPDAVILSKPNRAVAVGETDTFKLVYAPSNDGSFNESVKLYFSDTPEPRVVRLKGNLKTFVGVADIDCPTFNRKPNTSRMAEVRYVNFTVVDTRTKETIPMAHIVAQGTRRLALQTDENGYAAVPVTPGQYEFGVSAAGYNTLHRQYPISRNTTRVVFELSKPEPVQPVEVPPVVEEKVDTVAPTVTNPDELPVSEYAYNNIVFLIDVSSSMNTADRMPLLKKSMSELARRLRPGDNVAIVTYADKARVVRESKPVTDKDELQRIIETLTPNGSTSADKGLAVAHGVLLSNYLQQGNNQLVLATDGSFSLKESDLQLFQNGTVDGQPVHICVAGFGDNKDALKSLKKTSKRFNGTFIHIDKSQQATNALLDEVKRNSKR